MHCRPHLLSSSGEVDPFDLSVLSEDLVEILSRNVIQFARELQHAASLLIQGFLKHVVIEVGDILTQSRQFIYIFSTQLWESMDKQDCVSCADWEEDSRDKHRTGFMTTAAALIYKSTPRKRGPPINTRGCKL